MKNSTFLLLIVVLATVLTQWACQHKQDTLLEPVNEDISIMEAKSWLTAKNANARLKGKEIGLGPEEFWHLAQKQYFTNGNAVITLPLTYGYKPVTAYLKEVPKGNEKIDLASHFVQSKMLIYKDQKGNVTAEVIRIIPTDENRLQNQHVKGNTFSGYVIRYDSEGKTLVRGLFYKDGDLVDSFDLNSQRNGRQAFDCTIWVEQPEYTYEPSTDLFSEERPRFVEVSVPCPPINYGGGSIGNPGGGPTGGGITGW